MSLSLAIARARWWSPPSKAPVQPSEPSPVDTRREWGTPSVVPIVRGKLSVLMDRICEEYKITIADLHGPRRTKLVMRARLEFYYRALVETDRSLVQIAKACNRNHSSVFHGARRHCRVNNLPLPRTMTWGRRHGGE